MRVVRDLFTNDFEQAVVDHDLTYKRIVGYLKKTSPHMAEKVRKHTGKTALFEDFGVDEEIRSTLSRRVDLPSGGYLVFDYAEAFTVIDVNTGRFVGSRSKSSAGRLEDTITKNNLEAVKEVVRQLRLRDIGGIIVIDFIDMANPKNRAAVEEALKTELERDRTKTYVVEISPLGLVEMTRQNVSHGPREILTKRCPTCEGDGIVFSEVSAAVEAERKLRMLAASSRSAAFRVELNPHVAAALIGPGAERLQAIEERTRRRIFIEPKEGVPPEHFEVVARGPLAKLQPEAPVEEGQELSVKPVEVGLHDPSVGVAKHDGIDIAIAEGAKLVGKRAKVRITRVLDGTAYAELADGAKPTDPPITAEAMAEKPTRARRSRIAKPEEPKAEAVEAVAEEPKAEAVEAVAEEPEAEEPDAQEPTEDGAAEEAPKPKKRTRRGSRGGRRRKKKPAGAAAEATVGAAAEAAPVEAEAAENGQPAEAPVLIHLPDPALGDDEAEPAREQCSSDGEAARRGAACSVHGRRSSQAEEEDPARIPRRKTSQEACRREGQRLGNRRGNGRKARKTAGRLTSAGDEPGVSMGYAIIKLGGKQYVVREGEKLLVDRLSVDENKTFQPEVIFEGGDGKAELAPKGTVTAKVLAHVKGEKIRIGKYRRRTGYRRHTGFRSSLTQIQIESIGAKKSTRSSTSKSRATTTATKTKDES